MRTHLSDFHRPKLELPDTPLFFLWFAGLAIALSIGLLAVTSARM